MSLQFEYSACSLNMQMEFFVEGVFLSWKCCGGLIVKVLTQNVRDLWFESQSLQIFCMVTYCVSTQTPPSEIKPPYNLNVPFVHFYIKCEDRFLCWGSVYITWRSICINFHALWKGAEWLVWLIILWSWRTQLRFSPYSGAVTTRMWFWLLYLY